MDETTRMQLLFVAVMMLATCTLLIALSRRNKPNRLDGLTLEESDHEDSLEEQESENGHGE